MNNAENCKVVIVGETGKFFLSPGVGKTSIIARFVHNKFESEVKTTLGASYATKSLFMEEYDKMIKFEVISSIIRDMGHRWTREVQVAYEDILQRLKQGFTIDAAIAILVYDITRKNTFDELKAFWLGQIKENMNKKMKLIVAGNKADMFEYEEVKETVGKAFAKEANAAFKLVSAKSANGIDELFHSAGKMLLDPAFIDDSLLDSSTLSNRRISQRNPIKISRISQRETDIAKANSKGCC